MPAPTDNTPSKLAVALEIMQQISKLLIEVGAAPLFYLLFVPGIARSNLELLKPLSPEELSSDAAASNNMLVGLIACLPLHAFLLYAPKGLMNLFKLLHLSWAGKYNPEGFGLDSDFVDTVRQRPKLAKKSLAVAVVIVLVGQAPAFLMLGTDGVKAVFTGLPDKAAIAVGALGPMLTNSILYTYSLVGLSLKLFNDKSSHDTSSPIRNTLLPGCEYIDVSAGDASQPAGENTGESSGGVCIDVPAWLRACIVLGCVSAIVSSVSSITMTRYTGADHSQPELDMLDDVASLAHSMHQAATLAVICISTGANMIGVWNISAMLLILQQKASLTGCRELPFRLVQSANTSPRTAVTASEPQASCVLNLENCIKLLEALMYIYTAAYVKDGIEHTPNHALPALRPLQDKTWLAESYRIIFLWLIELALLTTLPPPLTGAMKKLDKLPTAAAKACYLLYKGMLCAVVMLTFLSQLPVECIFVAATLGYSEVDEKLRSALGSDNGTADSSEKVGAHNEGEARAAAYFCRFGFGCGCSGSSTGASSNDPLLIQAKVSSIQAN